MSRSSNDIVIRIDRAWAQRASRRLVLAVCALAPVGALASFAVVPNTFVPGEPIVAAEVNQNFTMIATASNDNHVRLSDVEQDLQTVSGDGGSVYLSGTLGLNRVTFPPSCNPTTRGHVVVMDGDVDKVCVCIQDDPASGSLNWYDMLTGTTC